jgi:serine/threonine-protein kinase
MLDRDRAATALPAYDVGGEIGRGGWGAVLTGRHRQLGREVAIKQLPRAFAASPEVRARFVAEAQVLASLDHPHIVPVYDFVDAEGLCLLVMEKLTLGTVWSRCVSEGLTLDQACAVGLATCAGLEHAHRQGILHRDVKPENLMFSSRGVLKVTDFGIAKVLGGSQHLMTRAGEVLGTPAYMAPEQAQAGELGPATDVYAAGVLLYELLSGRLPFADDGDALALLYRHVHEEPVPLRSVAPGLPDALAATVMRALARDPADRYQSAEAFGMALAEAAGAACGPGWVVRSEIPLMASGPILAAAERPSGGTAGGRAAVAAPPTLVDPPAPPATAPVRPSVAFHAGGGLADDLDAADVVPVQEGLRRPPFPWLELLASAVALAALGGVVLADLGAPSPHGDIAPGTVAVAPAAPAGAGDGGPPVDVTRDATLPLDLAEPIEVTAAPGVALDGARLRVTVMGIELGSAEATGAVPGPGGTTTAALDLGDAHHLAAGPVAAELTLPDGRRQVLAVDPARHALLTAPGALGAAATLFVLAYAESLLRSLRRGRKRYTATAGLAGIGLLAGVVAADLGWLAGRSPSTAATAACVALGGLAGLAVARVGRRLGQRRRPAPRRS